MRCLNFGGSRTMSLKAWTWTVPEWLNHQRPISDSRRGKKIAIVEWRGGENKGAEVEEERRLSGWARRASGRRWITRGPNFAPPSLTALSPRRRLPLRSTPLMIMDRPCELVSVAEPTGLDIEMPPRFKLRCKQVVRACARARRPDSRWNRWVSYVGAGRVLIHRLCKAPSRMLRLRRTVWSRLDGGVMERLLSAPCASTLSSAQFSGFIDHVKNNRI